jgi:hypothetical protein
MLLGFAINILLSRLLGPKPFGELAVAMMVFKSSSRFKDDLCFSLYGYSGDPADHLYHNLGLTTTPALITPIHAVRTDRNGAKAGDRRPRL